MTISSAGRVVGLFAGLLQLVAELELLGAQVGQVLVVRGHQQRHAADDAQVVALELDELRRVVAHEPQRGDAQVGQDLGADVVRARVDGQAELEVGLHGVAALILQTVRVHLARQPHAAPLVATQVDHHAAAFGGHPTKRGFELRAAIAAQRAEDVAGRALRVHAHQHVRGATHVAHHQRGVLGAGVVAVDARREHTVPCGQARLGDRGDQPLAAAAVRDQVGDADEGQAVAAREGVQLGRARHAAVVVDQLAQHARRRQAGQSGQVDRGLGVAAALEDASGSRAQWEDVPRAREVGGDSARVGQRAQRGRAVGGRDAGAGAVPVVDGDGERRTLRFAVVGHHQGQLQRHQALGGQRRAHHAAGVPHQERERGRRGFLGRQDQIALVLTPGVVDRDHHLAARHGRLRILDSIERHVSPCHE